MAELRTSPAASTSILGGATVALAVLAVLVTGGGQARASHIGCGDTITTDTTLDSDLVNCPNNGIIIGADDITLDLNGHTIDGDGTPAVGCDPETDFCDEGIPDLGHDGVTVMHGWVHGFAFGVEAGNASDVRFLGVSSSRNRFIDIVIFDSVRSMVRGSSGNGALHHRDGTGLALFSSHRVQILHNSFRRNAGDHGMLMVDSNNNLIKGNLFSRNAGEGMLILGGERNRIKRNRLIKNLAGIDLGPGSRNVITRNRVSRVHRAGIIIAKGHANLVAHNVVVAPHGPGIRLGIRHPFIGGVNNHVRGNLVKDSRMDGFVVVSRDHRSVLKHNTATGAGGDGIDVESRTSKLTRNRALRNADLGIQAVSGVTDGGGNVAHHNGDPRQCTNIVCN